MKADDSLYTEAHEAPLQLIWEKLALQYDKKLKFCPSNPTYDCIFNPKYAPLQLIWEKLALQYDKKLKFCPSNPTYDCIFNPKYEQHFNKKEKSIKLFGLWMKSTLKESKII